MKAIGDGFFGLHGLMKAIRYGLKAMTHGLIATSYGFCCLRELMKAMRDGFCGLRELMKAVRDGFCGLAELVRGLFERNGVLTRGPVGIAGRPGGPFFIVLLPRDLQDDVISTRWRLECTNHWP